MQPQGATRAKELAKEAKELAAEGKEAASAAKEQLRRAEGDAVGEATLMLQDTEKRVNMLRTIR